MATKRNTANFNEWDAIAEEWFLKLPPISKSARESIVNITPWIALIFGILGLLGTLASFGVLTVFSPLVVLGGGFNGVAGSIVSGLLGIIAAVLLLLAFPGTKKRQYAGWKMLFWSQLVSVVASVLAFSLFGVIIDLILFYLLYQIKPYYKK